MTTLLIEATTIAARRARHPVEAGWLLCPEPVS